MYRYGRQTDGGNLRAYPRKSFSKNRAESREAGGCRSGPQVKDDVTMCGLLVYECMYLHKASLEIWPQIVESSA